MDSAISKFIKLIGVTFLMGCLVHGYFCAQMGEWGYVVGSGFIGAFAAGVFTVVWGGATYILTDTLNGQSRSEITERSIIGPAVALPAVIACISFVGGGVAASFHHEFTWANWLFVDGIFLCGILTVIWSVFEISFVEKIQKIKNAGK